MEQNINTMEKKTRHTLLLGEGVHQHTLYGKFKVDSKTEFSSLVVTEESELRHEKPDTSFGEHKTLKIEQGEWSMGKQIEYSPFKREITAIWD